MAEGRRKRCLIVGHDGLELGTGLETSLARVRRHKHGLRDMPQEAPQKGGCLTVRDGNEYVPQGRVVCGTDGYAVAESLTALQLATGCSRQEFIV